MYFCLLQYKVHETSFQPASKLRSNYYILVQGFRVYWFMVKTNQSRISTFFRLPKAMISFDCQNNTDLFVYLDAVFMSPVSQYFILKPRLP